MNHKDFERRLRSALQHTNEAGFQVHTETGSQVHHEMGSQENKETGYQKHMEDIIWNIKKQSTPKAYRERIGFLRFLALQMKFIGFRIWICQGAFMTGLLTLVTTLLGPLWWTDQRYVIRVVCCFSLLVSMTALPFIHRSIYHKMHEIETSSLFSSMRLLLAKLILLGIGDVLILSMLLLVTAIRTSLFTDSLLLYLLFPFLLASSGALFLLRHLSAEHYIGGSLVFYGFLLILFLMSDGLWPVLYQQTFSAGWIAVCAGLAAFCIWQFSSLARQSSYAELQLT